MVQRSVSVGGRIPSSRTGADGWPRRRLLGRCVSGGASGELLAQHMTPTGVLAVTSLPNVSLGPVHVGLPAEWGRVPGRAPFTTPRPSQEPRVELIGALESSVREASVETYVRQTPRCSSYARRPAPARRVLGRPAGSALPTAASWSSARINRSCPRAPRGRRRAITRRRTGRRAHRWAGQIRPEPVRALGRPGGTLGPEDDWSRRRAHVTPGQSELFSIRTEPQNPSAATDRFTC